MKTTFKIIAIVAATFFTLDSMAQTGTTVEDFPACVTDASLDTFVSAIRDGATLYSLQEGVKLN